MTRHNEGELQKPWYSEGRFFVSPHNYDPAASALHVLKPGSSVELFDSTIRKILITPGLRPRLPDVLEIARGLVEIGIRRLTLNIHWWGEAEPEGPEWEVAQAILGGNYPFSVNVTCDNTMLPGWRRDYQRLKEVGLREPEFVLQPKDFTDSVEQSNASRARVRDLAEEGRRLGMDVSFLVADAPRADFEVLGKILDLCSEVGATRINLADSSSSLSPEGMRCFIAKVRERLPRPIPLLVHVHDDFGLATALAIAAVTSGAGVEVSVNGISDRAGFPALEEVAVSLESLYGMNTGLDMTRMAALCEVVSRMSLPPHPYKAISGRQAFMLDLPYAVRPALDKGRDSFPPPWTCVAPSWLGYAPRMDWLRQFLSAPVLELKLRLMGLASDPGSIAKVRAALADRLDAIKEYPVWIEESEMEAISRRVLGADA